LAIKPSLLSPGGVPAINGRSDSAPSRGKNRFSIGSKIRVRLRRAVAIKTTESLPRTARKIGGEKGGPERPSNRRGLFRNPLPLTALPPLPNRRFRAGLGRRRF
jgi:hypothetical protein